MDSEVRDRAVSDAPSPTLDGFIDAAAVWLRHALLARSAGGAYRTLVNRPCACDGHRVARSLGDDRSTWDRPGLWPGPCRLARFRQTPPTRGLGPLVGRNRAEVLAPMGTDMES